MNYSYVRFIIMAMVSAFFVQSNAHIVRLTVLKNPQSKQLIYCLGDIHQDDGFDENAELVMAFLRKYYDTYKNPMLFLAELTPLYRGSDELSATIAQARNRFECQTQCQLCSLPTTAFAEGIIALQPMDIRTRPSQNYQMFMHNMQSPNTETLTFYNNTIEQICKANSKATFDDIEQTIKQKLGKGLIEHIIDAAISSLIDHHGNVRQEQLLQLQKNIFSQFYTKFSNIIYPSYVRSKQTAALSNTNADIRFKSRYAHYCIFYYTIIYALAEMLHMQHQDIKQEIEAKLRFYEQCSSQDQRYTVIKNILNNCNCQFHHAMHFTRQHPGMGGWWDHLTTCSWDAGYVDAIVLHKIFSCSNTQAPIMLYFGNLHIQNIVKNLQKTGWLTIFEQGIQHDMVKGFINTFANKPIDTALLAKGLDFISLTESMDGVQTIQAPSFNFHDTLYADTLNNCQSKQEQKAPHNYDNPPKAHTTQKKDGSDCQIM